MSMIATSLLLMFQESGTRATQPNYFVPVALTLFVVGAIVWLIAAVMGFGRARLIGASARWFALSAVCLLLYHLHFLVIGIIGAVAFKQGQEDFGSMLNVGAFFNMFVVLGGFCAMLGFMKMKPPPAPAPPPASTED
jgi:hypothetical protein